MAEISTLIPSPPGLGAPPIAPSNPLPSTVLPEPNSAAPEHTKDEPAPMSFLYHPKALTVTTTTPPPVGESTQSVRMTERDPLPVPAAVGASGPVPPTADRTIVQIESLAGTEVTETSRNPVLIINQDISPAIPDSIGPTPGCPTEQSEPLAAQGVQQVSSPSPDLNPTPNLYPSVHVAHNPNPATNDAQTAMKQAQTYAASDPPYPPPDSTLTLGELAAPPQENTLQTQSPNPNSPSKTGNSDLPPSTPSRAEHPSFCPPVPMIHESAFSFSLALPAPNARPAPDTMSYLESVSLMSGTLESLSGLGEDGSSVGSDSEINGLTARRTDKYGFLGGNQYSESSDKDIRVEVARQREMKWLDMFCNWDKWVKHRFQKVKIRCRKGIPSSLRSKAWQLLSNSKDLLDANQGKFEELEREQGEAKWLDIIEKDLHRQFPFHEMFAARGGHGQQDLYRILKAYTIYRPDEGYCQAQAPVAAVLLMHMPAEQAFWCLVQICEKYLPGYYSAGLEAIQLDGEIFFSLLRRTCPMAYRHLKKFKIDPILYMTEWFMCIFSRTLPWSCVLRVWDMFFCEGVKIVFRVGLVLLKQMLGSVDKLRELQGMYETMERLRNISPDMLREDILVQEIVSLPVPESLIERECSIQVRKWRQSRGELTHQPGRRLHGTRAIHEQKRRASAISSGGSFLSLGSAGPPPGPLRASSSLLSLPGFRKSKAPFHSQAKKGSFSGLSGSEGLPPLQPATSSSSRGPAHKPPIPGAGPRAAAPHVQSPLAGALDGPAAKHPQAASEASSAQGSPAASAPNQSTSADAQHRPTPAPNTPTPSPVVISERITPTLPSPMANNAPLPPCAPGPAREPTAGAGAEEAEGGKRKKRSKEDKKKEKEDEKQKMKEKKEKERSEKERLKKEKEKKKEKGGKKKEKGSGSEAGERNGGTAAKDSA